MTDTTEVEDNGTDDSYNEDGGEEKDNGVMLAVSKIMVKMRIMNIMVKTR